MVHLAHMSRRVLRERRYSVLTKKFKDARRGHVGFATGGANPLFATRIGSGVHSRRVPNFPHIIVYQSPEVPPGLGEHARAAYARRS